MTSVQQFYKISLLMIVFLPHCSFALSLESRNAFIDRVIDGDTVVLRSGEYVRFIGIDTPEIEDEYKRNERTAQWLKSDVETVNEFALLAFNQVHFWLNHQEVRLEFDPVNKDINHRDKHGRLLAYIYRKSDDLCINSELIVQGFGLVYRRFDFKHKNVYLELEQKAKDSKKGLWEYSQQR